MAEIIKSGGGKFNKKNLLLIGAVILVLAGVGIYMAKGNNKEKPVARLAATKSLDNTNKSYTGETMTVAPDVKAQKELRIEEDRKVAEKSGKNQLEAVPVDASYIKPNADVNLNDLLTKIDIPCQTSEFNEKGFNCKTGFNKEGFNEAGFDNNGFNKDGCNKDGKDITGKSCGNFLQPKNNACVQKLIDEECDENAVKYDKAGFDALGYDKQGYDKQGFNKAGCDRQNYDKEGFHCQTKLNRSGFDRNGCDSEGYDKDGFSCTTKLNRDGFDKDGYDKDGFDKNGCNRDGFNKDAKPCKEAKRGKVVLGQGEKAWFENELSNKNIAMKEILKAQEKNELVVTFKKDSDFKTYVEPKEEVADGGTGGGKDTPTTPADDGTPKNNADIEIPTGSMNYATILADINSDYPGMVRAKILGGPLDQAMLIGNYTVPFIEDPYRPRDKIRIAFNQLVYNRITFPISAAGLDTQSMTDYISGDVDYHYLTRWGGLIGANILKGIGKAVATTGTSYSNDGSGTIYQQPITATGDQLKIAAGEVGSELSQIARQQFDRPPTVTSDRGSMIAIFFLKEINDDRLPMLFNSREQLEMNQKLMMNPQLNK